MTASPWYAPRTVGVGDDGENRILTGTGWPLVEHAAGRAVGAFPGRPAVIPALGDDVHFLILVLANVAAVKNPRGRIEGKPPRIAQPDRPKFRAHLAGIDRQPVKTGRADERIVRRNGVIGRRGGLGVWYSAANCRGVCSRQSAKCRRKNSRSMCWALPRVLCSSPSSPTET